MKPVELFHIGPQKSATTWVYRCLEEHPGVAVPPNDSVHYFDMFYAYGREWYAGHFDSAVNGQKLLDPTPSYVRSTLAPRRIREENPKAKIVISLRHPIERAFSHYWHEKKKQSINFSFGEILENYDLFSDWLEPGFYAEHIERYLQYFPREQMLFQRFDLLKTDPKAFLGELLEFYELDKNFTPSVLNVKVNPARPPESLAKKKARQMLESVGLLEAAKKAKVAVRGRKAAGVPRDQDAQGNMEKLSDVPSDVIDALNKICLPEIERLEALLNIDLSEWRAYGT